MAISGLRKIESDIPSLAVWAVDSPVRSGPTPFVEAASLRRALGDLAQDVRVVGFIVEPGAEATPNWSSLISLVVSGEWVGAAVARSVTEAVKQVKGDIVAGTVDRASLAVVTGPEVAVRAALEAALRDDSVQGWVSVTGLVGTIGPVRAVTV